MGKLMKRASKASLLALIETIEQELKNGNESRVMDMIQERIDTLERQIEQLQPVYNGTCWDFETEKKSQIFAEDDVIILRAFQEQDYDSYVELKKEVSNEAEAYEDEAFCKHSWKDVTADYALNCAMIRKTDHAFIGYCGLHDTTRNLWQIAIELFPSYHRQGYGYRGLNLFLQKVAEITGKTHFQSKVESDNLSSQALMKKMGAKLIDIQRFAFLTEEEALEYEEAYKNEITDHMRELAESLEVAPEKLLSHLLEYQIVIHGIF